MGIVKTVLYLVYWLSEDTFHTQQNSTPISKGFIAAAVIVNPQQTIHCFVFLGNEMCESSVNCEKSPLLHFQGYKGIPPGCDVGWAITAVNKIIYK